MTAALHHTPHSCTCANIHDRHGNQGILDTASNSQLENEFGSSKEDDVVKAILEKGSLQESDVRDPPTRVHHFDMLTTSQAKERQGDTNITMGGTVAH